MGSASKAVALLVLIAWVSPALAISPPETQSSDCVEDTPRHNVDVPPKLSRKLPKRAYFECRRAFRWQEKNYLVDSYYRRDGARLRPLIKDVPAAIASLDRYQQNQTTARVSAYIATIGLLIAGISALLPDNNPTMTTLKQVGAIGGLSLAGGSFIVSFAIIKSNESNLKDAVQHYNSANPQTPIELQFSTSILF